MNLDRSLEIVRSEVEKSTSAMQPQIQISNFRTALPVPAEPMKVWAEQNQNVKKINILRQPEVNVRVLCPTCKKTFLSSEIRQHCLKHHGNAYRSPPKVCKI